MKKLLLILIITSSFNCNAALVGNTFYFTDTTDNRHWMHVEHTLGMSYNGIQTNIANNGSFSGWTVASSNEFSGLLANVSPTPLVDGLWTYDPGQIEVVNTLMEEFGYTEPQTYRLDATYGELAHNRSSLYVHDAVDRNHEFALLARHSTADGTKVEVASVRFGYDNDDVGFSDFAGYVLYRDTPPVPVPAAVWFMGTGLLGLMGFSRKRSQVAA